MCGRQVASQSWELETDLKVKVSNAPRLVALKSHCAPTDLSAVITHDNPREIEYMRLLRVPELNGYHIKKAKAPLGAFFIRQKIEYSSDHHKKNTATKPAASDFAGVVFAVIPLFIDFDRNDEAGDGADGVHQIGAGREIAFDLVGGFVDTGVAVLGKADEGAEQRADG